MGFVHDPVADLALLQGRPHRGVSQLFRRDEQHRGITEADAVERVVTLRERQKAVDGDAGRDPLALQARNLVGHESDQGRDDDGERPGPVIPGKRRQLVTERLAGAGREDSENRRLGDRRCDNRLLQGAAILARRLRPEALEVEPLFEKARRVSPRQAPRAGGVRAGRVTESSDEHAGLGKLVTDPGRHDGVLAGHRDPGERVAERPAGSLGLGDRQFDLVGAGLVGENLPDRTLRRGWIRPWRIRYRLEERFEALRLLDGCREPTEGAQQIGGIPSKSPELGELVSKDGEDEPGVEFGGAGPPGLERPILVVLDQAVIRVAGKGERVEPEGVDGRLAQKAQAGTGFPQIGQIVLDYVVSENELRAGGVLVKRTQRDRKVAAAVLAGFGCCPAASGEAANPAGVRIDLEVDRHASRKERFRPHRFQRVRAVQRVTSGSAVLAPRDRQVSEDFDSAVATPKLATRPPDSRWSGRRGRRGQSRR